MQLLIEDAYVQIGSDMTRFWSTARMTYVSPDDATMAAWLASGRQLVKVGTEQDIIDTLVALGLGPIAPIPQPAPVDPVAVLQAALIDKGVIAQADLTAAATSMGAS